MIAPKHETPRGNDGATLGWVNCQITCHIADAGIQRVSAVPTGVVAVVSLRAKPDITLRIYAHLFRKDDGKAAAAINAMMAP